MPPSPPPLTVVLDVETTGLGHWHRPFPRPDGVVQVAYAVRRPGSSRIEVWREDCDPGAAFYEQGRADGAFRVNGMDAERLSHARPADAVASTLRARLEALAQEHDARLDLRAYNVAFDRPFLETPPWTVAGPWGPCLMLAAQARLGYRPKLAGACAALKVPWPEGPAHDAGVDAHAALLLHEALSAPPLATAR